MKEQYATEFEEHPYTGYRGRTLRNASADVTFAFAAEFSTAGEKLTRRSVLEQGLVYCPITYRGQLATENAIQAAVAALNRTGRPEITLNTAGNGLCTLKRLGDQAAVDAYAHDFLRRVQAAPNLATVIALVRSGGQTGFDEAGVKAAQQLGLRTLVLAPKGWTFRTADGQDINDEQAFKRRFHNRLQLANHHEVTSMSIDAFRKSSTKTDDLGKTLGPNHMYSEMVQGIRGFVYEQGLYIEATKNDFVLTIGNEITRSTSLLDLEQQLFDWAVDDGYEFKGMPYLAEHSAVPRDLQVPATSSTVYTADDAIKAIRARLDGVWDDPQLLKLGPLFPDELDDIHRILESVSKVYVPTPMERMLAEALRAMADSGGHYDDGDFFIEATEAERAAGSILVVRNAFDAVRVHDEAMGRYGNDKLNPAIPDFNAKSYTFDEILQRYRELLKDNPGKGLLVHDNSVAVLAPDSDDLYHGDHLGGPEVVDVTDLMRFPAIRHTYSSFEKLVREIEHPTFVDFPQGFEQNLRDALERRSAQTVHAITLRQFEEQYKPVDTKADAGEVTYLHDNMDETIQQAQDNAVWTLINVSGVERLCPGRHRVNAEAWIVCEVPWSDPKVEVDYDMDFYLTAQEP